MNVGVGLLLLSVGFICFRWPAALFHYSMMFDESVLSDNLRDRIQLLGILCMIAGFGIALFSIVTSRFGI
ncbi:hypothetical protein AArc1_5099 (plasmid) [Natrarchaeobaculum sulfurireducens]|uniref:Uncharacterized protein n=1 Tax=Natrarchaeobaculum sulfurireducens TaxID=2044521 RepID=A0A346P9V5_9EURY|nr:hypothetical protein AArc1_5099 [Natrarchaeobaculum sulfurireducens]